MPFENRNPFTLNDHLPLPPRRDGCPSHLLSSRDDCWQHQPGYPQRIPRIIAATFVKELALDAEAYLDDILAEDDTSGDGTRHWIEKALSGGCQKAGDRREARHQRNFRPLVPQ